MPKKRTILVAPLHWGLGHATRCIPIIRALREHHFDVLLASDGPSLLLLQKEFPDLKAIVLPGYNIEYPRKGRNFKWKLLLKLPHFLKTIAAEKRITAQLVASGKVSGIISDNRPGVRHKAVPCVYITHQLQVLSGNSSALSSRMHQKIIGKFDECWVPDVAEKIRNLSGRLGHLKKTDTKIKHIGYLSRMEPRQLEKHIDILVLLSGPEPQRSQLEEILKRKLRNRKKRTIMVRGVIEPQQNWDTHGNIEMVNFMESTQLEKTINESKLVICRPGYTSIMDLTILQKDAFFIPTPGQYEQEYLATRLKDLGIAPSCRQQKFKYKKLRKVAVYKGLKTIARPQVRFGELFSLFQGK